MNYKFLKLFSFITIFFLLFSPFVFSQENVGEIEEEEITVYFFEDRWCRVCREVKDFIEEIKSDYEEMEVITYPISDRELLNKVGEMHGVESPEMMAPTIFINSNNKDYYLHEFIQFSEDEKRKLITAIEGGDVDDDCCVFTVPFTEIRIDISEWSLPFVTIALGTVDGFNICSLGALILILSIVIAFESRKKIFFYGGLFIFITVAVYGLIVFAWRGLHEVLAAYTENLGFIIGGLAFLGGLYFLKEAWRFFKYGPTCDSSQNRFAINATKKLQAVFSDPKKGAIALTGSVALFAVIITLVELPCSILLPVFYTGLLANAGVPLTTSIFYILLYLFFYMLIEAIVFTGAVLTKKIWLVNSKAMIWVTLFGAIILFYLAFYYIL